LHWLVAASAASLVAGVVVEQWGVRAAAIASLLPMTISFCLAFGLRELMHGGKPCDPVLRTLRLVAIECPARRSLLLVGSLFYALLISYNIFSQLQMQERRESARMFGSVNFAMLVTTTLAVSLVHRLEKKGVDDRRLLAFAAIVSSVCLVALAFCQSGWCVLGFIVGRAAFGFAMPIAQELMPRLTKRGNRSTILGMQNVCMRVTFVAVSVPIIWAIPRLGLPVTMFCTAVLSGLLLAGALWQLFRAWAEIPDRHTLLEDADDIPPAPVETPEPIVALDDGPEAPR
jgi:MFS family permease